jgi:hypothetical protein
LPLAMLDPVIEMKTMPALFGNQPGVIFVH